MENNIENYQRLIAENTERLKELAAINQTTSIVREGKSVDETLHKICLILPKAWQYPEHTAARIFYENKSYITPAFLETEWVQKQNFETIDGRKGTIEVFYKKEFPPCDEGPFLKEERHLIYNLSNIITGYINGIKAKGVLQTKSEVKYVSPEIDTFESKISRELLQKFLNQQDVSRDIYHDLMPFKVKEILVIATLYDAYSIEKEGIFTEQILGEYHQLNLTSLPRITGVTSLQEAMKQLQNKHYDLVIVMMGIDKYMPIRISAEIKHEFPYIPVFLLINNNKILYEFQEDPQKTKNIDKIFVWNGDSRIFFAMVKSVEDKVNLENDTKLGLVGAILLVEDTPSYYSRYLPMLYSIVLEQTKELIEEVSTDELYKVFKLRARPKILLASDYEEAVEILQKFKNNILCLITDMKYKKDGVLNETAGIDLVNFARSLIKDLPTIIQSSEGSVADIAHQLRTSFINKNSETLLQDFRSFITYYLGFGNFIYRNSKGHEIAVARSLKEFEIRLKTIPSESLLYHATKNHFSLWLMARGEIQIAKVIKPVKAEDFADSEALRDYLIDTINKYRYEQNKGKVVPFEESNILNHQNIITIAGGALGGKGRGLAFINTLVYNIDFNKIIDNLKILTPRTFVIGTEEFEGFIHRNQLHEIIHDHENDFDELKKQFIKGKLSAGLERKLRKILQMIDRPMAIRSSGLFEDSLMQPFAGIFETYVIPNNNESFEKRFNQICDAIKLVYASVYSKIARGYIKAINYQIDQERMAVVIQELVGNRFGDYYYPHISGVAQSYNYYPVGNMQPEDGFAILALGLGKHVVEGEKAYRFCPKYPNVEIKSAKDQFKDSQVDFFAVDLRKTEPNLIEGEDAALIKLEPFDAEMHGTLKHLASVYDEQNETIEAGLAKSGARIVNFANILKYNYIPLSQAIQFILNIVKEAFGSPVEIEFAVDLNKDESGKAAFYLLQIKPLLGEANDFIINPEEFKEEDILLYTEKGMGNGIIKDIADVVYVDIEKFDKTKTVEIANEIDQINSKFQDKEIPYILIGPGRWGTRDRFIGIPVNWPQICNAKIIVETSLEGFPLEGSLGSHFFHNVTSMNVGYFTIQHNSKTSYIKWELLEQQELVESMKYIKHVRFPKPLTIRMDGKKRLSLITWR